MTRAKKFGIFAGILFFISLLLNLAPIAWAAGAVYVSTGAVVIEKIALTGSLIGAGILTILAWFNRINIKSKYLLVLSVLCLCMEYFAPFLLVLTGCQLADEVIITPLRKHCQEIKRINKEIDKRG